MRFHPASSKTPESAKIIQSKESYNAKLNDTFGLKYALSRKPKAVYGKDLTPSVCHLPLELVKRIFCDEVQNR